MKSTIKALGYTLISFIVVALVVIFVVAVQSKKVVLPERPAFAQYAAGIERKTVFFEYMAQLVNYNNQEILKERNTLLDHQAHAGNLWWFEKEEVFDIASRYNLEFFDINKPEDWAQLVKRVDIVPTSLALAQSANESAWGLSRFAQKGHNYFGQWCYKKGCGFVPSRRNTGAVHEVARFNTPIESVKSYMRNINTHRAYKSLRNIRAKLRAQNKAITGLALATGLLQYSEKREVYVNEIKHMIRYNKLDQLDSVIYK
ncbi:glucosaminidase domain-containing protein [Catenovulum adriaticum]|uniref:Glucosaminidase domain-containing protein n=1 Tax=Catenovulum adriaticum TaxID=2984846 RepID=A0ABY7AP30_9ALTE|nr:glucosaminidase domain-containing protein [Catenovulum sp. TS8]WAJ71315.1 glucosaminidase domain-containing protein [Catenovulum sp. TS8]